MDSFTFSAFPKFSYCDNITHKMGKGRKNLFKNPFIFPLSCDGTYEVWSLSFLPVAICFPIFPLTPLCSIVNGSLQNPRVLRPLQLRPSEGFHPRLIR